ncbi:MAG: alpha-L-arabinofuranosidase C-terminal domain-containing protein [Acidobacteriota bacterium]
MRSSALDLGLTLAGRNRLRNTPSSFLSAIALAALTGVVCVSAAAQGPSLHIQVDHPTHTVSPTLYGLMTEEINFSYDGGIYAEMVRDRTLGHTWDALEHWTMVSYGKSAVEISADEHDGPSKAISNSLKVHVTEASANAAAGVQNDGYWGMAVRPNTTYKGSFYAKSDTPDLPVAVALVNDQTGITSAVATVTGVGSEWKQYTFTLKTGNTLPSSNNHLQLTTTKPATIWFDLVSLFPPTYENTPNGNRIDLMEKLAAMHPAFLRLPGGNYLEGDTIAERFDWKKTIGPLVDRPTHRSPWNYRSSDGMGLLEYLRWCEDLKMEPVLAVYAGYSLHGQHVNPGPSLEPYVQDALDEIEYVTGGPDTKWGAERVKDGHAAPFPLHYVEVGNEDFFDRSHTYDGRFAQFYKAIKAKYPQLQVIATTPVKSVQPDVIDEHYYYSAEKSFSDAHHYDNADRKGPKIFVGEWATREGNPTPDLQAALGDAAWMTGLERNSDLIVMASYAPLFVNVNPGGMQWSTDLIGYNALHSYGSPAYYAQVMFSGHHGNEVVDSTLNDNGERLYSVVTRDETKHELYIKVVNATSMAQDFSIDLAGIKSVKPVAKLITLSGKSPNATNSIDHPTAIVPVEKQVRIAGTKFRESFARYSINVLEVNY